MIEAAPSPGSRTLPPRMALCHWNQVVTKSHRQRQREERQTARDILPRDPVAPPPGAQQQHERQDDDGSLRQQRQKKGRERQEVSALSAALVIIEEGPERQEIQRERERILAFGDPGRRERRHRVHREERRAQPRAGNTQSPQDPPQQDGGAGVQQDVHDVVPDRVHPPCLPFRPEHGRGEREVILRFGASAKCRAGRAGFRSAGCQ